MPRSLIITVFFQSLGFHYQRNTKFTFENFDYILIFKIKQYVIPEVVCLVLCVCACLCVHVSVCANAHVHMSVFIWVPRNFHFEEN